MILTPQELEGLSKDEIIYEADVHKAVALLRLGYMVRSPSARERIEREAEKKHQLAIPKDPRCYGYVYVFAAADLIKIGMSLHDVEKRWRDIRVANPLLEPALYITSPLEQDVNRAELACHAALQEYRVSGEWFRCSRELAIETVKRIEKEYLNRG